MGNTEDCTYCGNETKRSTMIFAKGKEYPTVVEEMDDVDDDDDIALCYDCFSKLND